MGHVSYSWRKWFHMLIGEIFNAVEISITVWYGFASTIALTQLESILAIGECCVINVKITDYFTLYTVLFTSVELIFKLLASIQGEFGLKQLSLELKSVNLFIINVQKPKYNIEGQMRVSLALRMFRTVKSYYSKS